MKIGLISSGDANLCKAKFFMEIGVVVKRAFAILIVELFIFLYIGVPAFAQEGAGTSFYSFEARRIDGQMEKLEIYKGKVLLVVNTASKCGFTPQYKELQDIYERYKDRGFVILAFPSNDFANQEPGTNEEIEAFCKSKYGISFPIFERNPVIGLNKQPVIDELSKSLSKVIKTHFQEKVAAPSAATLKPF